MPVKKLAVIALFVASCSTSFNPMRYPDPLELMAVSEGYFREGNCGRAIEGFRQITLSMPPRDSVAVRARFFQAECHFSRGEFLEAARQFQRVFDDAPNNRLAPRALLRAGDSQTELWRGPELDPTYGEAADGTYRLLASRFPNSSEARVAQQRLAVLAEQFAEKAYRTGLFYFRIKAYDSAILYLRNVVAQYGRAEYAVDALFRLIEIYERLEYEEERTEMCQYLRQVYTDAEGVNNACPLVVPE